MNCISLYIIFLSASARQGLSHSPIRTHWCRESCPRTLGHADRGKRGSDHWPWLVEVRLYLLSHSRFWPVLCVCWIFISTFLHVKLTAMPQMRRSNVGWLCRSGPLSFGQCFWNYEPIASGIKHTTQSPLVNSAAFKILLGESNMLLVNSKP